MSLFQALKSSLAKSVVVVLTSPPLCRAACALEEEQWPAPARAQTSSSSLCLVPSWGQGVNEVEEQRKMFKRRVLPNSRGLGGRARGGREWEVQAGKRGLNRTGVRG